MDQDRVLVQVTVGGTVQCILDSLGSTLVNTYVPGGCGLVQDLHSRLPTLCKLKRYTDNAQCFEVLLVPYVLVRRLPIEPHVDVRV